MSNDTSSLVAYRALIKGCKLSLFCDFCGDSRSWSANALQRHIYTRHRNEVPSQLFCPWCPSSPLSRFSWRHRQKSNSIHHLMDCFLQYCSRHDSVEKAIEAPLALISPCFSDHPQETPFLPLAHSEWLVGRGTFNQIQFLQPDHLAIQYLQKYIHSQGSSIGWYHVTVRAVFLSFFFKAFQSYVSKGPSAYLLKFSSWCDGGSPLEDPLVLIHRHLIVVAEQGDHFLQTCWGAVTKDQDMRCLKITSWHHLKDTIYYVSSSTNKCVLPPDSQMGSKPQTDSQRECSFYMLERVSPSFTLAVALALEGGLQDLITELQGQGTVASFASQCVQQRDANGTLQYAVKIRDVFANHVQALGGVYPVAPEWISTDRLDKHPSDAYVNLVEGLKLHFERRDPSSLLNGHCLWEAIGEGYWFPPKHQQQILNELVPVIGERCESHNQALKAYENQLNKRNQSLEACQFSLTECQMQLKERTDALNGCQQELKVRTDTLNECQKQLREHDDALAESVKLLKERDQALDDCRCLLHERDWELRECRTILKERDCLYNERGENLKECRKKLNEKEQELRECHRVRDQIVTQWMGENK